MYSAWNFYTIRKSCNEAWNCFDLCRIMRLYYTSRKNFLVLQFGYLIGPTLGIRRGCSSMSLGHCLIGTLWTILWYKASRDSYSGESAHAADGNGTLVPKVEMHQLKKLSIGVAQCCNSMCREAIVEALTLLASRPTCFFTIYIRSCSLVKEKRTLHFIKD